MKTGIQSLTLFYDFFLVSAVENYIGICSANIPNLLPIELKWICSADP